MNTNSIQRSGKASGKTLEFSKRPTFRSNMPVFLVNHLGK